MSQEVNTSYSTKCKSLKEQRNAEISRIISWVFFLNTVIIIVWMAVEDKIVLSVRNKKLYERIIADSLVS